jgi:general secretion pathway protein K
VLSARLKDVSLTEAALIIVSRDRAHFLGFQDLTTRFQKQFESIKSQDINVNTNYFMVHGKVKLSRSSLEVNALIYRDYLKRKTEVKWVREN